ALGNVQALGKALLVEETQLLRARVTPLFARAPEQVARGGPLTHAVMLSGKTYHPTTPIQLGELLRIKFLGSHQFLSIRTQHYSSLMDRARGTSVRGHSLGLSRREHASACGSDAALHEAVEAVVHSSSSHPAATKAASPSLDTGPAARGRRIAVSSLFSSVSFA